MYILIKLDYIWHFPTIHFPLGKQCQGFPAGYVWANLYVRKTKAESDREKDKDSLCSGMSEGSNGENICREEWEINDVTGTEKEGENREMGCGNQLHGVRFHLPH